MHLPQDLNAAQTEAVQTIEGPILVHAGPGSGKTRVIAHRIAYLVRQAGVSPRSILAVTFSRKAAAEMKNRLEALLSDEAAALTVATFHSMCLAILRREGVPGLGTSFEVIDEDEQKKLLKLCADKAGLSLDRQDLHRIKNAISYAKTRMINPDEFMTGQGERPDETTGALYRLYYKALKERHALDYDDMLVFTHLLFKDNDKALRKYQQRWHYILVDEFQDTSNLQYKIIKMLGIRHRNIFVVGDLDQTIYSWRQADMGNIYSFSRDFPGLRIIGMEENYRSTKNIVDAANALIAHNLVHKEKMLRTARARGAPLAVVKLADDTHEARFIAQELLKLAGERNLGYGSFAALYRTNAQSRLIEEAFTSAGIPYNLVAGTPFYKRREITDVLAWLRVLRNPADDAALARVIKFSAEGIGQQTLTKLQEQSQRDGRHLYKVLEKAAGGTLPALPTRIQRQTAQFYALAEELRALSRKISLVNLLNLVIEKTGYRQKLEEEEAGEERWENVLELISMAGEYENLSPAAALGMLTDRISRLSEAPESTPDSEAVTLNTLHGAKGTEFPVVFIAGVEEGLLPHSRSTGDPARLEEERRLCYVGITRAMELAYLTYAEKRHAYGEVNFRVPSRFIREIPAHLLTDRDLSATGK